MNYNQDENMKGTRVVISIPDVFNCDIEDAEHSYDILGFNGQEAMCKYCNLNGDKCIGEYSCEIGEYGEEENKEVDFCLYLNKIDMKIIKGGTI